MKKARHWKYVICDFISVMCKKPSKLIVCGGWQDPGFLWCEGQVATAKEPRVDDGAEGQVLPTDLVAGATHQLCY